LGGFFAAIISNFHSKRHFFGETPTPIFAVFVFYVVFIVLVFFNDKRDITLIDK